MVQFVIEEVGVDQINLKVRLHPSGLAVNVGLSIEVLQSFLQSLLVAELYPIVLGMTGLQVWLWWRRWGTIGRQLRSNERLMMNWPGRRRWRCRVSLRKYEAGLSEFLQ